MKLARSGYYYKPRDNSEKAEEDERIAARLEALAVEYPRYGYRRMTEQLRREGITANRKRVLRIMKERSLLVRPRKGYVSTTDSKHDLPVYRNLYSGKVFKRINRAWVADITYVRLGSGFCYLSVIVDAYSRRVVGWAVSRNIDTALVVEALTRAIEDRDPPRRCIHHSDRGKQYASAEYVKLLKSRGFRISMGRKGNPYDNAQAESFIKTLKSEEVHLAEYVSVADAAERIGEFIEDVYNKKRLHSALGYVPPAEFELSSKQRRRAVLIPRRKCPNLGVQSNVVPIFKSKYLQ